MKKMPSDAITNDKHDVSTRYFLYSPYYDPYFCFTYTLLSHIIKEITCNYILLVIFQNMKFTNRKACPCFNWKIPINFSIQAFNLHCKE